jgi:hypothetical protein
MLARLDSSDVAGLQQFRAADRKRTEEEFMVNLLFALEGKSRVYTAAFQNLKGTRKAVLVNRGGSVGPKQYFDVKAASRIQQYWGFTEGCIRWLMRDLRCGHEPAKDAVRRQARG